MPYTEDPIPQKDGEFDDYYKNILFVVNEKTTGETPAWTHIPQASCQELFSTYGAWNTAYEATKLPHTPVQTKEKNRLRRIAKTVLRNFINRFLRFDPVTAEDRARMGIREHDTIKTPVGIPQTRPEFSVVVKDIRRLALPFRDQGSATKARPYGMSGAVVRWGVQDAPPTEPEKLPNSKLATRTPYILNFTEEERGKTVYIAMCWQNKKGDMGSFSEVQSAVIP